MPEHRLAPHRWPPAARLFLISFLSLYFEFLLIRWLPSEIRILAYFSNVTLVSCILGLGIGSLVAGARTSPARFFFLLGALLALARLYHGGDVPIPLTSEGYFVWNGLSRFATGNVFQYVAMFLFFFLNTAAFIPLGQILGREFDRLPPLQAYSINVAGSLAGVGTFALFSLTGVPPVWWFVAGTLLLLPLVGRSAGTLAGAALIIALGVVGGRQPNTIWSPYYKIVVRPVSYAGQVVGHELLVNEDSHQQALDLSGRFDGVGDLRTRRLIYELPYTYGSNDEVIVVGAGTGNDLAAALRAGAKHVDAVEIDPRILRLGREIHPERPYDDPRIHAVNSDARTFLRNTDKRYDKIVLGYLDSHSLFSAMSSVRMDNFVYTAECFAELKRHLKPGGVLAVTFTIHEQWIADRLAQLFRGTFGYPPLVYQGAQSSSCGTVFLGGEPVRDVRPAYVAYDPTAPRQDGGHTWAYGAANGYLSPAVFSPGASVPTDDWPYLYLQQRKMPANYVICMLGLFVFSFLMVRHGAARARIDWNLFFLGAAFLLIETKAMTELSIFLGSTWIVNVFVISMILVLVLVSNLVAARGRISDRAAYVALAAILVGSYLLPLDGLLGWSSSARNWVAVTILCVPLFFSGLIFARRLRAAPEASAAFGSNLLGALAGGLLEYASMNYGFKALYLIALALYALSFVALPRAARV
ncbi:MAG TPA: class I SAM-dependent methyltransferase [Polyangia bacterium]|nr:class I SAM-dependent methyltransferase [Polyangia bacterium]